MAAISVPAAASGGAASNLALDRLSSTEPPLFLSPSPELAAVARQACSHLYSALLPSLPKPPPLDRLLAGADFDAEQIWCQIDDASRPLLPLLRRHLNRLQRDPPVPAPVSAPVSAPAPRAAAPEEAPVDDEDEDEDGDGDDDDDDDDDDEEEVEEEGEEDGESGEGNGVEDRFLKMNELEEFLVGDEAKEYGGAEPKTRREKDDDDGDDEDDEEDDEFGSFDDDGSQDADVGESARYEDFFESTKKKAGDKKDNGKRKSGSSKKVKFADELLDFEMDDEQDEDEDDQDEDEEDEDGQDEDEEDEDQEDEHKDGEAQDVVLSTHEKELQKTQSRIKQMEKANMEPKLWTMQGEVTAAKRPKNSALEVDLDFEHNVRPAPVITEEVTASLEDLIKKRINEDRFDDVQKAPALPSKAPKELKELDENKSKKGLAAIYAEDYAQKAGLVSAPLSSSDEQKKVATSLFKNLCVKLDALSHFHFAPKPIIEDMSIQTNVPALAMEEIAPVAVSDASMLAPEEIFEGKGDIKEETELTQAERKRRRASKKRRYKAEEAKRSTKRVRVNTDPGHQNGREKEI